MIEQLLKRLQSGDISGLSGTNLALEVPVSEALLTELFASRPAGGPIKNLSLQLLSNNQAIINLTADAPVVGKINRDLTLELSGEYDRDQPGLIAFTIVDGLKIFDKPIINLLQGVVERRLPSGIDLNAKRITIDFPRLLDGLGFGYLLALVAGAKLETRAEKLVLFLHLNA